MDSSSWVSGSSTVSSYDMIILTGGGLARVDAVQVVKVGGKPEPLNSALDVLFDMRGRVGHITAPEDIKAALGRNCIMVSSLPRPSECTSLTEYLVPDIVLANEVSQELLIDAGLVDDLFPE